MNETKGIYLRVSKVIGDVWREVAKARGITLAQLIKKTMLRDRAIKTIVDSKEIPLSEPKERSRTGVPAKVMAYLKHNGPATYGVIVDDLQGEIEGMLTAIGEKTQVGERRRRVMNAVNWLVRAGDLKRDEATDIVSILED